MTNANPILALKPYLEEVRKHCRKLSAAELGDMLCAIAQEVPPRDRAGFLSKLVSGATAATDAEVVVKADHDLISRIDALKEAIAERQAAIEDGSFYEEQDDWDEYHYDEEAPAFSDEQRDELHTLFAEADHLFLVNELEIAREAYALLLDMFRGEPDDDEFAYQLDPHDININWRETRARYCRCVYETADPAERIPRMRHALEIEVNLFEARYAPAEGNYPLLQDVFEARAGELADWKSFLRAWQQALADNPDNRAVVLFLEAVYWLDGAAGVAQEVRKRRIPVSYLFWLDKLVAAQAWPEAALAAQEALAHIPQGKLRAQAAEMLQRAGQETGNAALLLQGKREEFFSTPRNDTLARLIEEANRQQARPAELENALRVITAKAPAELRVKILLMLGRLTEAAGLIDKSQALGWSSGATGIGVFFGGMLTALTQAEPQATTIQALLKRYAGVSDRYFPDPSDTQETGGDMVIFEEIRQGLQRLPLEAAEKQEWFASAQKIGGDRIDAIVANQHRNSYRRAAEVLGALMECSLLIGQPAQARQLLDTYRNQKYKRHSSFRREVDTVLKDSKLLRPFYSKK